MSNIIIQGAELNAKEYVDKVVIEGVGEEKTLNPRIIVSSGGGGGSQSPFEFLLKRLWFNYYGSYTVTYTVPIDGLYLFYCKGNDESTYGAQGWPNTFSIADSSYCLYDTDTGFADDYGYLKIMYLKAGATVTVHNSMNNNWNGSLNFGHFLGSGKFNSITKVDQQASADAQKDYTISTAQDNKKKIDIVVAYGRNNTYVYNNTSGSNNFDQMDHIEETAASIAASRAGLYIGVGTGISGYIRARGYDGGQSIYYSFIVE